MMKTAKTRLKNFYLNDDACKFGAFCELKMPAEKYGLKEESQNFMINDFCQIGWSDPFPKLQKDG
jgi:glutathione peroxidase-family protein